MQTKTKTAKTAKTNKLASVTTTSNAQVATLAQVAAVAPMQAKAHSQWRNTASSKRVYGYVGNTPVVAGLPNTTKVGSARHTAIAAMQACTTMGAVYAVAATNWVHWAIQNKYIVPQVAPKA